MIPYCGFLVKKREFGYIKFREAVLTKINSILVSPPNLSDMPIATRHSIHFMGISRLQFGILIVRPHLLYFFGYALMNEGGTASV
jgi:hypothetical protein